MGKFTLSHICNIEFIMHNFNIYFTGYYMTTLQPRHLWLRNRIDHILDCIQEARKAEDFKLYKEIIRELVRELSYTAFEWDKYYPEKDRE